MLQGRTLTGSARRGIEQIYDPPVVRGVQSERFGGVITSAGVMSLTSAPQRTSPVRRGVWILDRLLGQQLEAPANVPPIEKAIQSLPAEKPGKLEIIRAHTAMPSCILCHKDIDPIGFGLRILIPLDVGVPITLTKVLFRVMERCQVARVSRHQESLNNCC